MSEEGDGVAARAATPRNLERELRRARAQVIIERHATYSALGSFLPFAAIDAITVGVLVFNMVKSLARHYQVPFEDDRLKALTSAVAGGLFAPAAGSIATHLVSAFIPWAPLVGAAASSASAAVFVKCVGKVFVQHFEEGGTLADVGVVGMRGAVRGLMVKG